MRVTSEEFTSILHSVAYFPSIPWSLSASNLEVAFSSHQRIFGEKFDNSFPRLHFLFIKWRSACAHRFHFLKSGSIHSGSASWDDCGRVVPDELLRARSPWEVPTLCLDLAHYALSAHSDNQLSKSVIGLDFNVLSTASMYLTLVMLACICNPLLHDHPVFDSFHCSQVSQVVESRWLWGEINSLLILIRKLSTGRSSVFMFWGNNVRA